MCIRSLIIIVLLVFFANPAFSLEFNESFDAPSYSCVTVGNHTWIESGGWSGGAAKFVPPAAPSQGATGLRNFGSVNARKVNVRFLYFMGSSYNPIENKWIILKRGPYTDGTRQIMFQHLNTSRFASVQIRQNVVNTQQSYPNYNLLNYKDQWICFEFESDLDANLSKVYVTNQNKSLNAQVVVTNTHSSPSIGDWEIIEGIGWYFQEQIVPDGNCYFMIDELRISTSGYIGPPSGFIVDQIPPTAPTQLRITN